jgi:hypothetical protein
LLLDVDFGFRSFDRLRRFDRLGRLDRLGRGLYFRENLFRDDASTGSDVVCTSARTCSATL